VPPTCVHRLARTPLHHFSLGDDGSVRARLHDRVPAAAIPEADLLRGAGVKVSQLTNVARSTRQPAPV
jgi:hypothetical protein